MITWGLLVLTCDYTYDCNFHVYIDKHIYIYYLKILFLDVQFTINKYLHEMKEEKKTQLNQGTLGRLGAAQAVDPLITY